MSVYDEAQFRVCPTITQDMSDLNGNYDIATLSGVAAVVASAGQGGSHAMYTGTTAEIGAAHAVRTDATDIVLGANTFGYWVNQPQYDGVIRAVGQLQGTSTLNAHKINVCDARSSQWRSDNDGNRLTYTNTPSLGSWTHFLCSYDGVSESIMYIDGVAVMTLSAGSSNTRNHVQYFLGRGLSGWDTDTSQEAYYDDFMLWDRVLTPAEVTSLYTNQRGYQPSAGGPPPVHPLSGFGHPLGRPGVIS